MHFEIPADNVKRAQTFYEKTFGWRMNPMPGFDYTMVSTSPSGPDGMPSAPGMINGGMGKRGGPLRAPVVTINVEDIDKIAKDIAKNGGKLVQKKQPVGDMGFTAYFTDSEGNTVGLWQTARK